MNTPATYYSSSLYSATSAIRSLFRRRRLLVIFTSLLLAAVLLHLSLPVDSSYYSFIDILSDQSTYTGPISEAQAGLSPSAPRISVIVIWEDKGRQASGHRPYFINFIESFRANADTVELVWIGVRQYDEESCYDPTQYEGGLQTSNIKFVCLDRSQFWAMHRDYFCEQWRCTIEESEETLTVMLERHDMDWYKSYFRLWRGYVFRQFMDPNVEWWGWADQDTFMGNFRSQFPWDTLAFDVLVPGNPGDSLLYLRGHLCFFRTGAETEAKLNQYRNLTSVQTYHENHVATPWAMEEAEFSSFIFSNPNISFLVLPDALIHIPVHLISPTTVKFATLHGTYRIQDLQTDPLPSFPDYPLLALPSASSSSSPVMTLSSTFSSSGITKPVDILQGMWEGNVWFPPEFTTHYLPTQASAETENWRRLVGRGGGFEGGMQGVWERFEPPLPGLNVTALRDPSLSLILQEGLYIHWFEEKWNGPWFSSLPAQPLLPNQTLVTGHKYGAAIWDTEAGDIVWTGETATDGGYP